MKSNDILYSVGRIAESGITRPSSNGNPMACMRTVEQGEI
jgi:hypothetical protein